MQTIDPATVDALLDVPSLVAALHAAFRDGAVTPVRHHHNIPMGTRDDATLLLMPAWDSEVPPRHIGVKTVTVHPDNPAQSTHQPSVQGVYLLLDGQTGVPRALIDGPALTARRTAAASALASRFLSRPESQRLVMIGTGRLVPDLIVAHCAERPIDHVSVWGRNQANTEKLVHRMFDLGFPVEACTDLEAAVTNADIVSCATTSRTPVFDGAWLTPGTHVDLVGGFRPDMREADDTAIGRARIFVDTRAGAMSEAGDIVQPMESGLITADDIIAELSELCRDEHVGRASVGEITLFKSVGTALEDLAAAELLIDRVAP
ncbi:MAG: ornithine cyclodeaminase family protein [Rhodospirillaceae bacterium]|nr:ornithine cyclodeaminase family protein [Rhodospirillaceae bacterium]MBT3809463.1 ornithine cyclodeaminase family protein [Rhodospirillaceae bacterium]MBT3930811.1 ornithine cyclodeaminase family protein [Rhodospirillaceae bacterium]MBT4772983.1 ornithine cyclodeaminase family protein [Rhodospirillaceae bacterium]MBT5359364.1 ornithine cyclodeaminase family protein [Rhodospirillaceae bacterium]